MTPTGTDNTMAKAQEVYEPHRDKELHIKVCKAVYEPHRDKQNK